MIDVKIQNDGNALVTVNKFNTIWPQIWGHNASSVDSVGFLRPLEEIYFKAKDSTSLLKHLFQPSTKRIAIVGTRETSAYATDITKELVSSFSSDRDDTLIISGLSLGIDKIVHQTAQKCGIPNLAVIPCGLDSIYPKQNEPLANEIMATRRSGLMTIYPDGAEAQAVNFLERMKAVVLLSNMVIVPFCKSKGGAMLAAKIAFSLGIPVYTIPGRKGDTLSTGPMDLLSNGIAKLYEDW